MFKLLGWMVKATLFAAIVLILGNTLEYHGETLSDQVRTSLSHAEQPNVVTNTVSGLKSWANHVAAQASSAAHNSAVATKKHLAKKIAATKIRAQALLAHAKTEQKTPERKISSIKADDAVQAEDIQASEREQLRTLIRQLNDSTQKLSTN